MIERRTKKQWQPNIEFQSDYTCQARLDRNSKVLCKKERKGTCRRNREPRKRCRMDGSKEAIWICEIDRMDIRMEVGGGGRQMGLKRMPIILVLLLHPFIGGLLFSSYSKYA
jgi:hypothetical protein